MNSRVACGALAIVIAAACGSKGPPLPPVRLAPARPEALTVTRVQGEPITLRIAVPAANEDGSTPADVASMRIFAITRPATDAPPSPVELATTGNIVGTVDVAAAVADAPPPTTSTPAPPPPPPAPGAAITWEDKTESAAYPTPMVRYYAVAGVSRRNRVGVLSDVVALPLSAPPAAPSNLTASFTETAIKLEWLGTVAAARYRIYEVTDGRPADAPLNPEPQAGTSFEDPRVEFGAERCYLVRAAAVTGGASIESAAAGPICITPRDVFPPPAPANLTAVAGAGAISLIWDAVQAADLAGYLVLRAEAPGEKLLPLDKLTPLFAAPTTETTYKDATTVAGTRYVYAVVAVDKASPPNRSALSNRVEETGRD